MSSTVHGDEPFFVIGIILKRIYMDLGYFNFKKYMNVCKILVYVFWTLTILLFYCEFVLIEKIIFYLNIPFLILIVLYCLQRKLPRNRIIEFIGKNSLVFYLWHVCGKLIVVHLVGNKGTVDYYILNIAVFILEVVAVYIGTKNKIINKYVFGNVH